ncbi:hypothetical protein [Paenibacillus fonticola]|uniref:hypothetical protein n=1 Tax=Paenibacillus fonticola TaxID=379896 RepID=UPI00037D97E2|nr:hypothetical protein [Paenibacillus fonticola]
MNWESERTEYKPVGVLLHCGWLCSLFAQLFGTAGRTSQITTTYMVDRYPSMHGSAPCVQGTVSTMYNSAVRCFQLKLDVSSAKVALLGQVGRFQVGARRLRR